MVKLLTYCVLLSSLFLGCAAGIVDPSPVEPTDASGYFWPSDIVSATYLQKSVIGNSRTPITLHFKHDSNTSAQVTDGNGNEQFKYKINAEGIYLENLTKVNSFIPLPDSFSLGEITTTYTTFFREMKKVLVVGETTLLALDASNAMFATNDRGVTWTPINWQFGPISTWTYNEGSIYIGTQDGMICTSTDMGITWKVLIATNGRTAITAIAVADSLRNLYYATDDSVLELLGNGKEPRQAANNYPGKSVTSLAITGNVEVGFSLSACTEGNGIWTAPVGVDTLKEWVHATTNWPNCSELVAIDDETLCALANIGGQVKIITSTKRGLNWSTASVGAPEGGLSFLAASGQRLIAVTKKGLGTSYSASSVIASRTPLQPVPTTNVNGLSGEEGMFAVATDSGIFIITPNTLKWQNISTGPLVEVKQQDAHVKGSLLLLQAGENNLDTGSTWDAGKCYGVFNGAATTFFITAKVSAGINEFSLETLGGNKYADVLPIQYIFSKAVGSTDIGIDTYRLIIYYAKGIGPIFIQQYLGQVLLSEMYRN